MATIEFCGRPEIHLPHQYDTEISWYTTICAGEVSRDKPAAAAIQWVIACAMSAAADAASSHTGDSIEDTATYRISQAFESFADDLRQMLEQQP